MRLRKAYLLIAILALLLPGCRRHAKMISRSDMISIYSEMLLVDQAIREDRSLKKSADTSLVYEPIFEKYGYNTDDYLYSVSVYMKSPDKYSKLLKAVSRNLDAESEKLQKQLDFLDKVEGLRGVEGMSIDSLLAVFSCDSLYIGRPEIVVDRFFQFSFRDRDSLPPGCAAALLRDSLEARMRDSLLAADMVRDSLAAAVADSLRMAADSASVSADSASVSVADSLLMEKTDSL